MQQSKLRSGSHQQKANARQLVSEECACSRKNNVYYYCRVETKESATAFGVCFGCDFSFTPRNSASGQTRTTSSISEAFGFHLWKIGCGSSREMMLVVADTVFEIPLECRW